MYPYLPTSPIPGRELFEVVVTLLLFSSFFQDPTTVVFELSVIDDPHGHIHRVITVEEVDVDCLNLVVDQGNTTQVKFLVTKVDVLNLVTKRLRDVNKTTTGIFSF